MLCSLCAAIFDGEVELGVAYDHHGTSHALRRSAQSECHMCIILEQHLSNNYGNSWVTEQFNLKYKLLSESAPAADIPDTLWFNCPTIDSREDGWGIWIRLFQMNDEDHETLRSGEAETKDNTASETSMNVVSWWLKSCLEEHEQCRQPNPGGWVPSRLIDVASSPPRLCKRTQVPLNAKYTTLSHRWKAQPCLLLTTTTLPAFEHAIPVHRLSEVFRDAIETTKRFGVQYLWIDSLCILQDSKDDWAQESAQMGDVYKFGYCNFAATADAEGNDGFFVKRNLLATRPGYIQTHWKNLHNDCYVWAVDEQMWYPPSMSEDTLQLRGWILQEGYLAPRTVHFTRNQLQWECRRSFASEVWPYRIPDAVVLPSFIRQSYFFKSRVNEKADRQRLFERWVRLVSRYTSCLLTRESDRLVAFSAVAKEFAALMEDRYLGGMWEKGLVQQLDWFVPRSVRKPTSPDEYVAPSWSWASAGTTVGFPLRFESKVEMYESLELIKVVDATTSPEYDTYGTLREGHITIRGLPKVLKRVKLNSTIPPSFEIEQVSAKPIIPEAIASEVNNLEPNYWSSIDYDTLEVPPETQILYLPTFVAKYPGESRIVGIALIPMLHQASTFKRIGSFDVAVEFWEKGSSRESDEADAQDEQDEDDGDSEIKDPTYFLHLYWEWDLLSRTFFGESEPLFEFNPATGKYSHLRYDELPEMMIV